MDEPLRIGNCSGFYGDRYSAVQEMLEGGPLDVLTGDYLAELTMLILGRDTLKDPSLGYAKTFLRQMRDNLALALDRGVKIVVNAGGLNPVGLREALIGVANEVGVDARIAHVEGDDLRPRAGEFGFDGALTANAYLGGWGIAACLDAGADVVVTGRVTDAAVVVGPAAQHFGWARDDWDRLAGAVAAGHVIECGAQATGGNYAFFRELDEEAMVRPGFPIAEVFADGSSFITKHPGTGGAVTVGTVTAQLLYEIGGPRYANPDVTTRFDTITVAQHADDRVLLSGTQGEPPPRTLKVATTTLGGFRNEGTFILTGLDIEEKAELVKGQVAAAFGDAPPEQVIWTLARTDEPDAGTEQQASALLRCQVRDPDATKVGRAFTSACIEIALASYPGFSMTAPPQPATPMGVYRPAFVPASEVPHVAVLPDGARLEVAPPSHTLELADVDQPALPPAVTGTAARLPLGAAFGARSGDKGGSANVGVWARTEAGYAWLANELTTDRLRELLPEAADLPIDRHLLPNLLAVNFVIHDLLDEGVSSATRFDPQAKGLGEWLRSRIVDLPADLAPTPG